jgi:hypothetical protein
MAIGAAVFGLQAFSTIMGYQNAKENDRRSLAFAKAQALRNNELAARNYELINEEEAAEMVAHGMGKFELAKSVRAAKATAAARMGGTGALSSRSLQAVFQNIERTGANQAVELDYNFGRHLRNLEIERVNNAITVGGLNAEAYNGITQSANLAGTALRLGGLALSSLPQTYKLNPHTGQTVIDASGDGTYNPSTGTY